MAKLTAVQRANRKLAQIERLQKKASSDSIAAGKKVEAANAAFHKKNADEVPSPDLAAKVSGAISSYLDKNES